MSRRLSERKAKIAASHFLKRLTGADDFDGNSCVSAKRKLLKSCDGAPVGKKSKTNNTEQETSTVSLGSLKSEAVGSISKNHRTPECSLEVKPCDKASCVISTRSRRTATSVDAPRNKKKKPISAPSKLCMKKDNSKHTDLLLSDECNDNVKCEPIIGDQDEVMVCKSNCADSSPSIVKYEIIDAVIEPAGCANDTPCSDQTTSAEQHFPSSELNFVVNYVENPIKSEVDLESVLCNDYEPDNGVNSFGCSLPACSGFTSVVTAVGSLVTDVSDAQSDHSHFADKCESKDSASDNLVIDSCGRETITSCSIEYPTMSLGDFLAMFGLVNKSDLPPPSSSLANRLHREAGGTLRRCIKSYRKPQMVYRRTNPKDLCVDSSKKDGTDQLILISAAGSNADSQKVVYGLRKVQASKSRFSQFATKKTKVEKHYFHMKASGVDNVALESNASSKKDSELAAHDLSLLADAALANVALNDVDGNVPSALSKSSPVKEEFKKPKSLAKIALPQVQQDAVPSRRSARQSGSQRREWRHLLRANPDEHETKPQDGCAEIKRTNSNKAKEGKTSGEASSIQCSSPLSTKGVKEEHAESACKSEKIEISTVKKAENKNVVKGSLRKSQSLPNPPTIIKNVKPASGGPASVDSRHIIDLCDEKDDTPEKSNDWGILKYRYKEMECVTPHMCTICWINDHMYCKNMKRTGSDLPHFLPCIHYIACSHFRTVPFSSHCTDSQGSAFRTISGEPLDQARLKSSKSFRWDKNELISIDVQKPAQKIVSADDLLCEEVMPEESDADSSNHSAEGTELLQIQLKARTAQIFQSLGVAELPHGKSPPLIRLEVDVIDDCSGELLELTDIASEICIGENEEVNSVGEFAVPLSSSETNEGNYVEEEQQSDVSIVQDPNLESVKFRTAHKIAENGSCHSYQVTDIDMIDEEQLDGLDCAISLIDIKVNGVTEACGESWKQKSVKNVKKKVLPSNKCKTALGDSVKIAVTKKFMKSKKKSAKNATDADDKSSNMGSGQSRSDQCETTESYDKLSSLLLAADSDLIVCQTALEQQKQRQSVLKADATQISEQLKMKRSHVATCEKIKSELKRRYDSLQSQLTDIKRSALQYHQFVDLFDKLLPASHFASTGSSSKSPVPSQNSLLLCETTKPSPVDTTDSPRDTVSQPVGGVRACAQSVLLDRSSLQCSQLTISPTGTAVSRGTSGIKPSETSCKPCVPRSNHSLMTIRYGEQMTVKPSEVIRTVATCQSQPSLRSVQFVSSSVRLVVPPGWSLPVSRAQSVSISAKPSAPVHMGEVVRAVYVNPSSVVRHVSHKLSPSTLQTSAIQTCTHSGGSILNSPLHCSQSVRFSTKNFVPVISASSFATKNATVLQKSPVVRVSDDEDSEPELCFYGYKDRSFLQSQAQPMPNMLTPDPSCSSQESTKSSQDY